MKGRKASPEEDREIWQAMISAARAYAANPTCGTGRRLEVVGRRAFKTPIPRPHTRSRLETFRALSFAAKERLGRPESFAGLADDVEALMAAPPPRPEPYFLRD